MGVPVQRAHVDYSGSPIPKATRRERTPKEVVRKAVNPKNAERSAFRRAQTFGPQAMQCRRLPCVVCGAPGPSEAHHEPPRSVGGLDRDCVSLCHADHGRRHAQGEFTFWAEAGIDPEAAKEWVRDQIRRAPR